MQPGTATTTTVTRLRTIETAFARDLLAYVAAIERVTPDAGAGFLEVGAGVATFTGTGSPLSTVKGVGPVLLADDLDAIEAFGREHHTVLPIELAPWPTGEADALLVERGYHVAEHEDVVAMTATSTTASTAAMPFEVVSPAEWTEIQLRLAAADDGAVEPALATLLAAASRFDGATNLALRGPAGWIAAAQSVPYGDVVVLGDDATHPAHRRQGAQSASIRQRVDAVPAGHLAIAEVAPGSGSERNYLRCGFELAYTRRIYVRTEG
jgi:hypothetical protein